MGLENLPYIEEDELETHQQTTTITIENPHHPHTYASPKVSPQTQMDMFEAAQWAKDYMGTDRALVVGDFLMCLRQAEQNDNAEPLYSFIEEYLGDEMARNFDPQ